MMNNIDIQDNWDLLGVERWHYDVMMNKGYIVNSDGENHAMQQSMDDSTIYRNFTVPQNGCYLI